MKVRYISFHNGNLNPELLRMQKAVFDKFEKPLEQIQTDLSHGEAIDHFLNTEEWDYVFLFDADCIPLTKWEDADFFSDVSLLGSAQKSSHLPHSKNFIAPSFMILSRTVWERVGKYSMKAVPGVGDVAELFSTAVKNEYRHHKEVPRGNLIFFMPIEVEKPMWRLDGGTKFGYGTTYAFAGLMVYHAFESNANHHSTSRFIKKCQEVLDE